MKKRRLVLSLLSGTLMLGFSTMAFASSPPEHNRQNKTNWCWAATAMLVGETNGGYTLDQKAVELDDQNGCIVGSAGKADNGRFTAWNPQRAIVVDWYGNDGNNIGTFDALQNGLQIASADDMEIGRASINTGNLISTAKSELNADRYVAAFVSTDFNSVGHFLTMVYYDQITKEYCLYDPWDQTTLLVSENDAFTKGILVAGWKTKKPILRVDYCR